MNLHAPNTPITLPAQRVRYHKKRDGILRITPSGYARFLTRWERVLYALGQRP